LELERLKSEADAQTSYTFVASQLRHALPARTPTPRSFVRGPPTAAAFVRLPVKADNARGPADVRIQLVSFGEVVRVFEAIPEGRAPSRHAALCHRSDITCQRAALPKAVAECRLCHKSCSRSQAGAHLVSQPPAPRAYRPLPMMQHNVAYPHLGSMVRRIKFDRPRLWNCAAPNRMEPSYWTCAVNE
jgi:hypothetical protein